MTEKRKEFFARLNVLNWAMDGIDTKADWDLKQDERIMLEKGYHNLMILHAKLNGEYIAEREKKKQ